MREFLSVGLPIGERFPNWREYVVPWGDAVCNQAQAADLESDIADLKRAKLDPQLLEILTQLEPLVARLARETHVYLWFIGD